MTELETTERSKNFLNEKFTQVFGSASIDAVNLDSLLSELDA